jgi:hypothetical protein
MATMLIIFVPQHCDYIKDNICTIYHHFYELKVFNIIILTINFISLISFIVLYIIEYKREIWCIEYLDINPNIFDKNLKMELEKYPEFKTNLATINNNYMKATFVVSIITIINFITSIIFILYYYYLDYRTITVIISNFMLVVDKLNNCIKISTLSIDEGTPSSAYVLIPIKYNTIDNDYKQSNTMERTTESSRRKNIGYYPPLKFISFS